VGKGAERRAHAVEPRYDRAMSRYRRARIEGGTFFFTLTLADRSSDLLVKRVDRLRDVYRSVQERRPFETVAICLLPDHLHAIWSLPPGDADFARRWSLIKSGFSRSLPAASRSSSKLAKRENGIWQRRYWEHAVRDDTDLARHVDYIHFNPVKHGLVSRVCDRPHSSFHQHVKRGLLPADWGGDVREIVGSFGE
jgi:putative transposase